MCYLNQVYFIIRRRKKKKVVGIGMEREAHYFIIIKFNLMFNSFSKLKRKNNKQNENKNETFTDIFHANAFQ